VKKINIGIIGCGYWGPNFIRNFIKIKGVNVKYICDIHNDRLTHIKELYPEISTTQDLDKVLKDKEVSSVVIATPAKTHYKLVKASLLNHKHVLVEKPITTKIKDAEELIALSKEYRKILMVGHTFKFNPGINALKELIDSKKLGKIFYLYSRRTNLGPLRKDVNAVWDLAPHDISILNYLLSKVPESISAKAEKYLAHNLEDVCFVSLRFPKNILAHIHVSWLDPKKVREIVVVGSKRMAVFDDLVIDSPITIYDKTVIAKKFKQEYDSFEEFQMIIHNGPAKNLSIKKAEPLFNECLHFIDCIKGKSVPLTDGKDGLEVLKVLIGIERSIAKKGATVILEGK
jgi:predicted dehydrogenase